MEIIKQHIETLEAELQQLVSDIEDLLSDFDVSLFKASQMETIIDQALKLALEAKTKTAVIQELETQLEELSVDA